MSPTGCILLLPARGSLRGELAAAPSLLRVLSLGDRIEPGEPGDRGQLCRVFDVVPERFAEAAVTRQMDVGDAGELVWLRADPAFVQPEMNGVRLMAVGELLLKPAEVEALLAPLKPLFGDAGFLLDAPVPQRWYLQMPKGTPVPTFAAPEQALGDDLSLHLPQGELGKRWRQLLNEAQILLHNNPVNEERAARGKKAVNSLWFWGAGALPEQVVSGVGTLISSDPMACGLARLAGIEITRIESDSLPDGLDDCAIDLRNARDLGALESAVFAPLLARVMAGQLAALTVDFGDGFGFVFRRPHRLRFWRRPPKALVDGS